MRLSFDGAARESCPAVHFETMAYYVYLNWVAKGHRACIHRGECSFCKEGQGVHSGSSRANGEWLPSAFDSISEAEAAARLRLPTAAVRRCGHCLRS